MNTVNQHKTAVIHASVAAAVMLCLLAASFLVTRRIAGLNARAVEADRATLEAGAASGRSLAVRRALQTASDADARLRGYLLAEESVPAFLAELDGLARRAGVALSITDIQPPNPNTGVLSVSMAAKGSFGATARFASLLGTLPYRSAVSRMELARTDGGPWSGAFTVELWSAPNSPAQAQ